MNETVIFNLLEPQGGLNMFLKVIYSDGKLGIVKSRTLDGLIKAGQVLAFHCSEGWVEARRKRNTKDYRGPERRRSNLVAF